MQDQLTFWVFFCILPRVGGQDTLSVTIRWQDTAITIPADLRGPAQVCPRQHIQDHFPGVDHVPEK